MIDLFAYEQYLNGNLSDFQIPDIEINRSLKGLDKLM